MNLDHFWKIIESSRRVLDPIQPDGNMQRQSRELWKLLSLLSPEEVLDFRNHFFNQMDAAFQWDLWGAAYIIADGCSDDGFVDFLSWLISMGRRVFENAVVDAESLIEIVDAPGIEDIFFEEFQYVPAHVYEKLTGQAPPGARLTHMAPAGEKWNEDGGDLKRRLPRLWARAHPG